MKTNTKIRNIRIDLSYMFLQYYNWKLTLTDIYPVDPELDYFEQELIRSLTVYDV